MQGEIGFNVGKAYFSKDMVAPISEFTQTSIQMSLHNDEGECFHICGNNDWGYLLVDAFIPLLKAENRIKIKLIQRLEEYDGTIGVIGLGKNAYRAMDIVHRFSNNGKAITEFNGIPVIKTKDDNGIKLFGTLEYAKLPF